MEDIQTTIQYLKQSRILENVPDNVLKQVIPLCRRYHYSAGSTILKESSENDQIYVLMSGQVSIYANDEFIVALRRRGDIFGEMSVITGELSSASVIAVTPVEVLGIKAKDIGKYNLSSSETLENIFFKLFAKILSEKLAITTLKARKHEITNRQLLKTQKELEQANREAYRAVQAKSVFLAMMSHEIRTPLNSIIGNTELLYYTDLSDKQEKHVNTIYRSGEILLSTINNILDFSSIETGQLKLENQPFSLKSLSHDLREMFATEAENKKIELRVSYDDSTPESFIGDKARIRQVLINLLGNAVKFTSKGFVQLSIKSTGRDDNLVHLEIAVQDSGIGIPASKQSEIWEMFSQADASFTRKFGGSGLGLAICKSLIGLMKGTIFVDSIEGNGSTFTIQLSLNQHQET